MLAYQASRIIHSLGKLKAGLYREVNLLKEGLRLFNSKPFDPHKYLGMRTTVKLTYAILVATSAFSACHSGKTNNNKINPSQTFAVLTLVPQPATTYSDFPATIQGKDIVEIRPMVDGYLEKIYVPEGAIVKKGAIAFPHKKPVV